MKIIQNSTGLRLGFACMRLDAFNFAITLKTPYEILLHAFHRQQLEYKTFMTLKP